MRFPLRQINKQLAEENKKLAEQHNNHKKFLDKVVYTNVPTDDFFGQFNKSSRWALYPFLSVK